MGKRMRPFSLWHRLLLGTVQSPFLCNGDKDLRDVCIAVGICRTQFGNSKIRKPWLTPSLVWGRMLLWALLPHRKTKTIEEQPEAEKEQPLNPMQRSIQKYSEAFLEYAGDYLQNPDFAVIPPETSGRTRTLRGKPPAELDQVCDLIGFGISEDRAWNMGIGLANWYRVMALKHKGADIDFIDKEEKEFQSQLPPGYRWKAQNN